MPELYSASQQPQPAVQQSQPQEEEWRKTIDKVLLEAGEKPRRVVSGAYHIRPHERFIMQQQDEEIVMLLRAHPITNVGWILLVLGMLIVPSLLLAVGMFAEVDWRYVFIGRLTWYLVALAVAFEKFLHWYYTLFLVTNERLVDIDFVNLMHRIVTYANLNHIEEPAMVTGGFVRSIFQYGNVHVTTASNMPSVEALAVPWPHKVVDIISRLSEELEKRRERGE